MNKYILPYSEKLNESIGRGSVLLIKGRPTENGRFLYVTTIKGYAEIKPGIKMVFIGDTIYRVIYKGNGKFAGRKVSYRGEDGLKGVFNMKNPGRPSVVLNHNKTPFHWITLKHLDIGSALREIGTRLFNHELILESNNNPTESAKSFLLKEVLKLITGQSSILRLEALDVIEGGDDIIEAADDEDYISDYETIIDLTLTAKPDDVVPELVDELGELGLFPTDLGIGEINDEDRKLLGLSNESDGASVTINYITEASLHHTYDPGDYDTPSSGDTEVTDVESSLLVDHPFLIDGDYVDISSDAKTDVAIYDQMISDQEPSDFVSDINSLIRKKVEGPKGFERTSELNAQLRGLYYNYIKALVNLNKNGLTDEDKEKWPADMNDRKMLSHEKELMNLNYQKARNSALGKDLSFRAKKTEEKLNKILNSGE